MASMLAAHFSIVTVIPRMRSNLEELIRRYGMEHRINSIRISSSMCVLDLERNPKATMEMLKEESKKAVEEDDAEAILLGCAGMVDFANNLESELGVPVIDGVVTL